MVKNKAAARLCCISWPGLSLSPPLADLAPSRPVLRVFSCWRRSSWGFPWILLGLDLCSFPSCLSSLFIPHMKSALRVGWVKAYVLWRPCLCWVFLELISAPHLPKDSVLKMLPCESSPCSPRDQHGCRFLNDWGLLHVTPCLCASSSSSEKWV